MPMHRTINQVLSVAFITFATTLSSTLTGVHWLFPISVFSGLATMWVCGYNLGKVYVATNSKPIDKSTEVLALRTKLSKANRKIEALIAEVVKTQLVVCTIATDTRQETAIECIELTRDYSNVADMLVKHFELANVCICGQDSKLTSKYCPLHGYKESINE